MSPFLAAGWAAVLIGCIKPIGSHDLFWHLRAGELILSTGNVPRADWLTGLPWVDFEWLAQALYALVYRAGGLTGLIALKAALLLGAASCLERLMARRGAGPASRGAALCALAGVWSLSNDVRPENFSMLLLSWLLLRLEGGLLLGEAAALFALWANLHAGFVLGLAALGAHRRWRELAVAACATLVNPFGPAIYDVIAAHLLEGKEIRRHLIEWYRPSPLNAATWPFWLSLGWLAWSWRKLRGPSLVLAAALACGALSHQRAALPFSLMLAYAPPPAAMAALAGWTLQPRKREPFPEGTADYLAAHPELHGKPMYNPWGWGGYLGWRVPALKLYWDGRYIFHDRLPEERAATAHPELWRKFLDDKGFELVLLERAQPDIKGLPYWQFFMSSDRWELLTEDRDSLLFGRRKLPKRKAELRGA